MLSTEDRGSQCQGQDVPPHLPTSVIGIQHFHSRLPDCAHGNTWYFRPLWGEKRSTELTNRPGAPGLSGSGVSPPFSLPICALFFVCPALML